MTMRKKINYTGDKRFRVNHPKYGEIVVAAPDDASAVYAAGYAWKVDPTRIDFLRLLHSGKGQVSDEKQKRAASTAMLTTPSELSADDQSANDHSIAQRQQFSKG